MTASEKTTAPAIPIRQPTASVTLKAARKKWRTFLKTADRALANHVIPLPDAFVLPTDLLTGFLPFALASMRRNRRIMPKIAARTPAGRFGFLSDELFFPPAVLAPGFLPFAFAPTVTFDRATACLFVLFSQG